MGTGGPGTSGQPPDGIGERNGGDPNGTGTVQLQWYNDKKAIDRARETGETNT